jgi:ribonuclease T1
MKRLVITFCALLALTGAAFARGPAPVGDIALGALPGEAHATLALIKAGGPFADARDGRVFGNFEKILPARQRGYYREFTVRTPGAHDRGARRIVAGAGAPVEYYYTDDHYNSFRRIRE